MPLNLDKLLQDECEFKTNLFPWIVCQQSLTDRLRKSAGEARLQILHHSWEQANWWDIETLKTDRELPLIHREIIMWAYAKPCWYARTIIPNRTYHNHSEFFERLRLESLGTLIFESSIVKRQTFLTYAVNDQCLEYHWPKRWINHNEETLWVRLSEFTVDSHSTFYLVEILLPELLRFEL